MHCTPIKMIAPTRALRLKWLRLSHSAIAINRQTKNIDKHRIKINNRDIIQ